MKAYTFDIGFQDVTINATSEEQAWKKIQQFGQDGYPITLIDVRDV